jgi:hypothetical protein
MAEKVFLEIMKRSEQNRIYDERTDRSEARQKAAWKRRLRPALKVRELII